MGVIVEFNGLTGCGKSTLIKEFLHNIENENVYCEYTNASEGEKWNSQLVKCTHKNFSLKYVSFGWLILSIYYGLLMMIVFVFSRTQSRDRRIRYLRKSLQLWLSYRIFEKEMGGSKNNCILLIDEGIICSLASLIHTSTYSEKVVKKIIHCLSCYKKMLIVNFEVDFEWSYQNIRNRKKGGRFDRMSDDELSGALRSKEELFSYIQSSVQTIGLDCILIKSKGNVHDNAIMLRGKVNERNNQKN